MTSGREPNRQTNSSGQGTVRLIQATPSDVRLNFRDGQADAFQDSEYFLLKIEIEKLGVETETVSISKKPVEIYSFFKSIGHLNIDKSIDQVWPWQS